MKRILLIIIFLLCIGCTNEEIENVGDVISNSIEKMTEIPEYVDNNPIKVGLYRKGKLVSEFNTKFHDRMDITTFNVVFSNLKDLGSTNLKDNWYKYYNSYENIDEYKIGFYVSFKVNGELYENLMLDPSNQHKLDPYLYLYLYDGVHAKGSYTHLKMEDLKEDTIYSSIKLYLHLNTKEITSPITLSVFTYRDDNDFIDGKYRGNSIYTINIYNK